MPTPKVNSWLGWRIFTINRRLISLFGCKVCRGYEQRIQNVHDGRVVVLSQVSNQARERGNLCASRQVHKEHPQEIQDGRLEAPVNTDEYNYSSMRTRTESPWTRRSTGAWSAPSCTWRWWGRTSSFMCVCTLVFRRRQGLHIGKPSSGSSGIFDTLLSLVFIWYSVSSSLLLLGFPDADFAGCRVDQKSTSGSW
jgi:hypothetical protein